MLDDMEILIVEDMIHYVNGLDKYLKDNGIDVTERNTDLVYQIGGFRTQLTECIGDASDFLTNYNKKQILMVVDGSLPFTKKGRIEKTGWQGVLRSVPKCVEDLFLLPFSSDDDNNENMQEAFSYYRTGSGRVLLPFGKSKTHQYPGLLEFIQE